VKKCNKQDKQNWFDSKATEAEQAAQTGDIKTIYRLVKEQSDSHRPMIKLADGQRATMHEQQANRWHQHFQKVLISPEPGITHDFDSEISDTPSLKFRTDHRSYHGEGGTSSRQENEQRKSCWHRPNPARTAKVLISHNSRADKLVQQHTEEQNRLAKWYYNSTSKKR